MPGTLWDHEGHQPALGFRYGLVRLLVRVIATLKDGTLPGAFQTDGQSILLEDYSGIRPDCRDQINRLARTGRLALGPWHSIPDEFTISGKASIAPTPPRHR